MSLFARCQAWVVSFSTTPFGATDASVGLMPVHNSPFLLKSMLR